MGSLQKRRSRQSQLVISVLSPHSLRAQNSTVHQGTWQTVSMQSPRLGLETNAVGRHSMPTSRVRIHSIGKTHMDSIAMWRQLVQAGGLVRAPTKIMVGVKMAR